MIKKKLLKNAKKVDQFLINFIKKQNNSLIVANPDFNKNLKNIKKDNSANTNQLRSGDLIVENWEALPGTIKEGKVIASLIRGDLIQGKNATAIKIQEEKNPKIIHIASHSYFLEDMNLIIKIYYQISKIKITHY